MAKRFIKNLTEETSVAPDDKIAIYDASADADRSMSVANLLGGGAVAHGLVTGFNITDGVANNWTDIGFNWKLLQLWVQKVTLVSGPTHNLYTSDSLNGDLNTGLIQRLFPFGKGFAMYDGDQFDGGSHKWPIFAGVDADKDYHPEGAATIIASRISSGLNFEMQGVSVNGIIDFVWLARG